MLTPANRSRKIPPQKFPLRDLKQMRVDLRWVYEAPIPSGGGDGLYPHNGLCVAWLVRCGWAQMEADGATAKAQPGEWLISCGRNCRQMFSGDARIVSLRARVEWPDGRFIASGGPLYVFPSKKYPAVEREVTRLLQIVHGRRWRDCSEFEWRKRMGIRDFLLAEARLFHWIDALARALVAEGHPLEPPTRGDERISRVLGILDRSVHNPFPVQEIEAVTGIKIGQANRLARRALGITLNRYWEERRSQAAQIALVEPGARIKEVAIDLGFAELSHFSAWFKRHTGQSPRTWQKNR